MKDLYGLKAKDVDKLKYLGYLNENSIVYNDGNSIINGEPLYVAAFDTSEDRDKAYEILFGCEI